MRLETWLDKYEHATRSTADELPKPEPADHSHASHPVVFRIAGNFGVDVIVEGPVEDANMLREQVALLIREMQRREPPDD